jgi:F0F1-type ATP synthase delta subunit
VGQIAQTFGVDWPHLTAQVISFSIVYALLYRLRTGVDAAFALDPGVIGGMRLTLGSDVYDGSVRVRLAALDARF